MRRFVLALLTLVAACPGAIAWNAEGHRIVTYLALDGLPTDMPEWLRDREVRDRIAYQASEPDRWRGTRSNTLAHENNPDHYLDVDSLDQFGLTLDTVPPLRYEFLKAMIVAKREHPEMVDPYDDAKDADRTREWPGFVLHAIAEHYAKLRSGFNTLRILESLNDPTRAAQLAQARENVVYEMGVLSHFVGDAAQPLHTTKHHHGWVGPNPNGYTTDYAFHAFIDGGVIKLHALSFDTLRPLMVYDQRVNAQDPWRDELVYIRRSFELVEPLYKLQKSGELEREAGKKFIAGRLTDAGAMLEAMYHGAWIASEPTDEQAANFVKFDEFSPASLPR